MEGGENMGRRDEGGGMGGKRFSGFSCLFEKTPHFDTKMEETDTKSIFFQQNACTIEKKAVSLQSNSAKAGFLHSPDRVE